MPHDVYRVRDNKGALLYVGCSVNAFKRIQQHKYEYQRWFPLAATVDIDQYCDRTTARYIEAHAIKHEAPIWNTAQEAMALIRGKDLTPEVLDSFVGIPVSAFWAA
jgi:predicted GIY-YIG superfamily endonuclease